MYKNDIKLILFYGLCLSLLRGKIKKEIYTYLYVKNNFL